MEQAIKQTSKSLQKNLKSQLGLNMTPRQLQSKILKKHSQTSAASISRSRRKLALSDRFKSYHQLVAMGSRIMVEVAANIYLDTTKVIDLIGLTREEIGRKSCYPSFDSYLENLLRVAAGDPDMAHRKDFSDFLVWSATRGIISKRQAIEYYNSYFSFSFMSLPDEYNVCSQCRNQRQMEQDMFQELDKKKKGMAQACDDRKSYNEA